MLIDWFTVFAQLLNFLILMALLKRFLYKPILRALDAREKKIAGHLKEAKKLMEDAERERSEYVYKNELFEQQRGELLKQAQQEAEHERVQLIETARTETTTLRAGWQQALQIEQSRLHHEIMRHTRREVFAITRKTLADLASESLENRISEVFIQRLKTLGNPEKNLLSLAIKASSKPVTVRSVFELSAERQRDIKQAVRETLANDAVIEFITDNEHICGIELTTNGHKLSWTISDYLSSLEQSIDKVLEVKTLRPSKSGKGDYAFR